MIPSSRQVAAVSQLEGGCVILMSAAPARSGRGGKDAMWGGIARGKGSQFAGVDRNRLANYLFILKSDSGG